MVDASSRWSSGAVVSSLLEEIHNDLDGHFHALRAQRNREFPGQPLFALEHGLEGGDLTVLGEVIRSWVLTKAASSNFWLPFVVFAAESGYEYNGEDYWPILEVNAPGWERHTERHYVRRRFEDFAKLYGGAVPKGRWASHFRIICWPITHAVLPMDLQKQLVRLLYEYRGVLTAELLANPTELGDALAAHTAYASKRFRQFAENTDLLGHVAAALLAGSDDKVMLLDSTLQRIVSDLSTERESRVLLRDAKNRADHVRLRGFAPLRSGISGPTAASISPTSRATAPVAFTMHPTSGGWQLRLRVPDFTPLFSRYPDLPASLASLRCRVAGFDGPPRPRGWLRYAGQELSLDRWPGADAAVFELERADPRMNKLVGDEARTPPSGAWLFVIGSDGTGRLVRSAAVRPGSTYVLLGPQVAEPTASWVTADPSACSGAAAVRFTVPDPMQIADQEVLRSLGCASMTSVAVDPVGFVPVAWDGESYGEWLVGDKPVLMLTTSHPLRECSLTLDGTDRVVLPWNDIDGNAFVQLTHLAAGWHHLHASFLTDDDAGAVPDGHLDILLRTPEVGAGSGTFREPLQTLVSPASASLADLWEGRAAIELIGPPGATATIAFSLDSTKGQLARHQFGPVSLPLGADGWRGYFAAHVRARADMQRSYDEASTALVEITDAELGSASASFERLVTPLRWGFRAAHGHQVLRLHEEADTGVAAVIDRYAFAAPDRAEPAKPQADSLFFHPEGGLFVATLDSYVARAVLLPVRDLYDLHRLRVAPYLRKQQRTVTGVSALIDTGQQWSEATLPGDPFASAGRESVRAAVAREISVLIGGRLWATIERRYGRGESIPLGDLDAGLARPGERQQFRRRILELAGEIRQMALQASVEEFAKALDRSAVSHGQLVHIVADSTRGIYDTSPGNRLPLSRAWLSEYLLRLASEPGSIPEWAGEYNGPALAGVLETPVVLRAARMLVLAADSEQEGRWTWG